ncbi:T-complex protein 1 subunit alpha, partial [Intoshia linei]
MLSLDGSRQTGHSARSQNINACLTIANTIKSSFGPLGLDKILVDEVGDVTITNDGATILKLLNIEHPAAKVMVELAKLQEKEVGDGTTSVVLFAAELMKQAQELIVTENMHPTIVNNGYKISCKESIRFINSNLVIASNNISQDVVINAIKTSISSKIIRSESEYFSKIIIDVLKTIKKTDGKIDTYPIKSVKIVKCPGKSMIDSKFINGVAIYSGTAAQTCIKSVNNAKIALFDFSIARHKMKINVSIVVNDPKKLEAIRKREFDITLEKVTKIISSSVNVIACGRGVGDEYMKYFTESNIMVLRRVNKSDLKRLSKTTGATLVTSITTLEGSDSFDSSYLGYAESVVLEQMCDEEIIIFNNPKFKSAASIILRGPNYMALDEIQRAIEDGMYVVKRALESKKLVCGGGSVEVACSIHLENFAKSIKTKEQLAIIAFSKSLLVIPKQLSLNAGIDSLDLVCQLRAFHFYAQINGDRWELYKYYGLDLNDGDISDNHKAGILEPYMSKNKMLKLSTEAAITILRV